MSPTPTPADAATFFDGFLAVRGRRRVSHADISEFFDGFVSNTPQRPLNVFRLFKLASDELTHSAVIAWLLGPHEEHGCGPQFLSGLMDMCQIQRGHERLGDYTVRTEFPYFEAIVDILIYRRAAFLIYVENKVVSAEGPCQLDHEYRDLHRLAVDLDIPRGNCYGLFLTPTGRQPHTDTRDFWRTVSYSQLLTLARRIQPAMRSPASQHFVDQWCTLITTFS